MARRPHGPGRGPEKRMRKIMLFAEIKESFLMAMGALREHPTPEQRKLLDKLLKDADPAVQAAARAVAERLKALAAESPSRYASDSPSATTEPSTTSARAEAE